MPKAALAVVEPTSSESSTASRAELSYDSLFAATVDPTVIVDATCGSVVSANVAAARLLGIARRILVGMPLPTMLENQGPAELRAALGATGRDGVARLESVRFRGTLVDLSARLSLVRAGKARYVLVHFSAVEEEFTLPAHLLGCSLVYDAIDSGAAVMVVTDADFNVLYANRAFLRLIDVDSLQEARGRALSQWLELSREDLCRMRTQMASREMATTVSVRLHHARRLGSAALQALAIAVPDGIRSLWGFSISERSRIN